MKIAVVGTGSVGSTLGRRFAQAGHDVTFGARSSSSEVKGGVAPNTRVTTVADAVRDAEVVLLTVPWAAVPDALRATGALEGKILVDVTNPLVSGPGGPRLDVGPGGESAAERIAAQVPRARVVKAFNTTGANNMADPEYGGEATVMFFAGDDVGAKATVRELVAALGFEAVDAGPLHRSRELEHLAMLWIALAMSGMGREIAFKLARRASGRA